MRKIDLAGEWLIRDTNDEYTIDIKLPSTTELSKIAFEGINYECEKEHLRRLYYVNRNIFYKKQIYIDEYFADKPLEINLERSKYTKIYIDGELASFSHDTVVMQHHKIKRLTRGMHELIIAIDNNLAIHEDFDEGFLNGHQYTDHTQTNWNGIMGQMYICVDGERKEKEIMLKDNITVKDNKIYDNGKRISLRGNLDCAIYPRTGVCPFTKEEWKDIFRIYIEYGMNHCRFHSWCPPECAFEAADELGIYLQVEMSAFAMELYKKGDRRYNPTIYNYFYNNGSKILKEYGNHKSFIIFAIGNELKGDIKAFEELVSELKKVRSDILITGGANNFLEQPVTGVNDDIWITMKTAPGSNIRGSFSNGDLPLGRLQRKVRLSTDWDYEREAAISHKPLISHETGQYEICPDITEEDKYIGPLVPDELKDYGARLIERGRYDRWKDYFVNSGKLTAFLYKNEIEAILRTDGLSGFQLLGLNDFPGQGMALVGILNSFYENKGIISAKEWREFCNDTVILLKFDSYVYEKGDIIKVSAMLYNYSDIDYTGKDMYISLKYGGREIAKSLVKVTDGSRGLHRICEVSFDTSECMQTETAQLRLCASMDNITNHYDIFVFSNEPAKNPGDIRIIYKVTDDDVKFVEAGGKAIFIDYNGFDGTFATDFWCYDMFRKACESVGKEVAPGTMGLYVNRYHDILASFPTDTYAKAQWQQIMANSKVLNVNRVKCQNIIEVIDNFNRCDYLSLMYEQKIGKGILITTGCDFYKHMDKIEFRQLYNSVINYLSDKERIYR